MCYMRITGEIIMIRKSAQEIISISEKKYILRNVYSLLRGTGPYVCGYFIDTCPFINMDWLLPHYG